MLKLVVSLVSILTFSAAYADQCQYVDRATAKRAYEILEKANVVHSLCQPCGEVYPTELPFQSVAIKRVGYENYWGVYIDDKNVDLAYTYADGINLADLAQCPADGVDHKIDIDREE
jgi:hypothetical protein